VLYGISQISDRCACTAPSRHDLGIVRGTYRMPVRDNVVPLSDGAGEGHLGQQLFRAPVEIAAAGSALARA
jgi:hypothetical protein